MIYTKFYYKEKLKETQLRVREEIINLNNVKRINHFNNHYSYLIIILR